MTGCQRRSLVSLHAADLRKDMSVMPPGTARSTGCHTVCCQNVATRSSDRRLLQAGPNEWLSFNPARWTTVTPISLRDMTSSPSQLRPEDVGIHHGRAPADGHQASAMALRNASSSSSDRPSMIISSYGGNGSAQLRRSSRIGGVAETRPTGGSTRRLRTWISSVRAAPPSRARDPPLTRRATGVSPRTLSDTPGCL